MGERSVAQEALAYSFNLERRVPARQLLYSIDEFVELSGIREDLAGPDDAVGGGAMPVPPRFSPARSLPARHPLPPAERPAARGLERLAEALIPTDVIVMGQAQATCEECRSPRDISPEA
jgi:hypothetical protein